MTIPKILIIDDQFGETITDRRNLCLNFSLKDITGDDDDPEEIKAPVAESFFCTSQREENGFIVNDTNVALTAVKEGWPDSHDNFWSLVLLDIRFVSGKIRGNGETEGQAGDTDFGITILEEINKQFPDVPVVMLSSRERYEVIEECREKGAMDFIQRIGYSSDITSPREILKQKLFEHALLPDTRKLEDEKLRIAGKSLSILKTLRSVRRAATGKGNILLVGETGTGKELFARFIRDISPRAKETYEVFHPFGRSETLQEDELFGHVKGSFTGATSDKPGLFEMSNGGTLFIDEIGDIKESLQMKLLRPLENKSVKRQGGIKEIDIDVQVVFATNKNLEKFARTGQFKSDLLNRINAYTITLPPLRERKEDIPVIAQVLLKSLCLENNARWPRKILPESMALLMRHNWADNVRGLRNVLERAVKNSKDLEQLVPADIKFDSYEESHERVKLIKPEAKLPLGKLDIDSVIDLISTFEFPADYSKLQGKFPGLQKAMALIFANYLSASIEATKKMKPGGPPEGEINLTGAVSCMMGVQLKTPKAADSVKRILQFDKSATKEIFQEYPVLEEALQQALHYRPKQRNSAPLKTEDI